ncbi:MAG: polysaccharide biosynthesis tyrosine autokinase [Chloroflexi bacterium]|nr:polysaccharide biosynthesis tyrosine autokinase [Chloroflexota bacterium]
MELRRYWGIFRKWFWLMALGMILAGGTSYAVSKSLTPIYAATVTLQVNQVQNPGVAGYNDILLSERLTKTYSELIRKRPVLDEAIRQLQLNLTYEFLATQVNVSSVRDTQLIQVTVQNPQPQQAADIANKIAEVFIAETAEAQGGQVSSAREGLRQQITTVTNEIRNTASDIERLRSGGDQRTSEVRAAEEARLQSTLSQYQLLYSQLVKNEQDLALAEARTGGGVRVADPAVAPIDPTQPKVLLNTLLAGIVGLLLAIGVAFLIEYLDDTVKTSEDLEQATSLPTLGTARVFPVERNGKEQNPSLIASNPRLHFGEAYRTLRTNLQFATLNHKCEAVLVTSAGPGEGKSFTISNLAVVFAQAGKRVLIVDSDIRRPTLHKYFNVSNEIGLTNLLLADDQSRVNPFVQRTGYSGLRLLASGPLPPNPSELLSSPQMARAVAALKEEADIVLFDSPPVLAVSDAAILSALVDGVMLVVGAGQSRVKAIAQAKEAISLPGVVVLGTVLNRVKAGGDGYYYYKYHYGHQKAHNGAKELDRVG